jgi:hypothetical protein
MSRLTFDLAGGSVVGRVHRDAFKNNQDSQHIDIGEKRTVAVVADGCGNSPHSEVGAQLCVRLLADILQNLSGNGDVRAIKWPQVLQHLLGSLNSLARQMGGKYRRVVEDYFLCTFLGVVIDDRHAVFFGLGDGVLIINDEMKQIGPYPDNAPPYAGYGLLTGEIAYDPELVTIWKQTVPLAELQHFLVGTDGVVDLIKAVDHKVPGGTGVVGDIGQFWLEDRYFGHNPELVSRQLKLYGRDWPRKDPEMGVLPDDTSFIVGRRRLDKESE